MDRVFSALTEADEDHLYQVVSDLGTYPDWLAVVDRAEPTDPDPTDPDPTGSNPTDPNDVAWTITLRARIGPLARSKRLRMVRTVHDGRHVRFERRELDGREHSAWTLSAVVGPRADGPWRSEVSLDLRYGGSLWSGLLDTVLQSAADDATKRLQAYVTTTRA